MPGYGLSQQVGSFGSWTTSVYATGPTTVPGLNYRVDGLLQHSNGFRNLESANYEIRPVLQWNKDNHVTTFALDFRHIERTPDPYGIVYFNGAALAALPLNYRYLQYSTPFSFGNQDFERGTLTDSWWFADYLTINNRLAYTHRDVSILRNSGGGTIRSSAVRGCRRGDSCANRPTTTTTSPTSLNRSGNSIPARCSIRC